MKKSNTYLYEEMPISRAIFTLVIPTVISQLITVLYNMADTFFIGQMNDPHQVAAATLAMPLFVMMTGFANLFGIGGASLISRALGRGERELAKGCAAFSVWSSIGAAAVYAVTVFLLMPSMLPRLGTTADTYAYCYDYLFWTVTVGAVPTILSAALAHLIRAEGYARQAGVGIAAGGILNIALDPLFIFGFKMEITGAAVATSLSNLAVCLYFVFFVVSIRRKSTITLNPARIILRRRVPFETLAVGFPSFMMMVMGMLSNIVLNKLVAGYSSEAIAGMGIAKKIDVLAFAIANGMTQGVISLIAYNYASGNRARMNEAIRKTFLYTLIIAVAGAIFLFVGAAPVVQFFIDNAETVEYGRYFLRVICITCPAISITFVIIMIFQATGRKLQPILLSLVRKGGFDIPLMFWFRYLGEARGIAWATPVSDLLAMSLAVGLFIPFLVRLKREKVSPSDGEQPQGSPEPAADGCEVDG